MNEPVIKCGCGRTMTLDGQRGRGGYRCGCRATVTITQSQPTTECSAPGCHDGAVRDLQTVPICGVHRKLLIAELLPEVLAQNPFEDWRIAVRPKQKQPPVRPSPPERSDATPIGDSVVYFIQHGDLIKIGTSNNLTSRMKALTLPPTAKVLLTVPGRRREESALHRRFAQERQGESEWFTLSPRMRIYIDQQLAKQQVAAL